MMKIKCKVERQTNSEGEQSKQIEGDMIIVRCVVVIFNSTYSGKLDRNRKSHFSRYNMKCVIYNTVHTIPTKWS